MVRDIWLEGDGGMLSMEEAFGDDDSPMPVPSMMMKKIIKYLNEYGGTTRYPRKDQLRGWVD